MMDYGDNISDASEDIFSDDDGTCDVRFMSPEPKVNSSFLNLSQTPVLFHRQREETPGKAIVPKTPLSLAPFISKADEWSSDMETPESRGDRASMLKNSQPESINFDVTQTAEPIFTPPHLKISTQSDDQNDEIVPSSQEIPPKKKQKRHPKRRIFDRSTAKCSTLYEDDEPDEGLERSKIRESQSVAESLNIQLNSSVKKLEELKEMQRILREKKGLEILGDETISDDEFLRSCRALEMCDRPQNERKTQPTPCTSSLKNSSEESPFSLMWDDLETLPQEEETVQQTISLTPESPLETNREDNFSQIDLGIDHIDQEDDMFLERTFIMDDDEIEIEKGNIKNDESAIEDGFRGFTKEEQENKEFWKFQRIFVSQSGDSSPKKLDFPGFSFVETEIAKTISQNNEIFLNNYLEKYYGIRKQVDPLVITIEDTESEASQPTQHDVPQLHPLAPLIVSVYSGFDTADGKKLFISADKIVKEQTKLQMEEPTEMKSIDLLISSINTENSIEYEKKDVQILKVESTETIDQNHLSESETIITNDENIENDIINKNTSLISNLSRDKCDKIIPPVPSPLDTVETVSKVTEPLDQQDDYLPGCVGFETLGKHVNISEKTLSRVDDYHHEDLSRDYADCLNEISNLKRKSRSLRLKSIETSASKSIVSRSITAKEVNGINQISNENCDPECRIPLVKTCSPSSPRVPEQNVDYDDERLMNFEGEEESIVPSTFDYNDFPQLRNTNYSRRMINSKVNGQFPGFSTGTGEPAQISEKVCSLGKTISAEAEKQVEIDVQKPSAASRINKFDPLERDKQLTSFDVSSTSRSPTGFITSNDRSLKASKEVVPSKSLTMGFTTGNGGSINLSEVAQERMKIEMREFSMDLDAGDPNLLELSSMKKKLLASRNKRITEKNPAIRKTTSPSLTSLKIQKIEARMASSPSKPTMGFTTGNGGSINLSEAAQERLKLAMEEFSGDLDGEDSNLQELSSMKEKLWASRNKRMTEKNYLIKKTTSSVSNNQKLSLLPISKPFIPPTTKKPEPRIASSTLAPTLGFTTAGGGSIKLSEAALEQMKAGLEAYTPYVDETDPNLADLSSLKKKVSMNKHEKPSDSSEKTPTISKIPIIRSELPLRRTSLPFMSKPFTPLNVKRPEPRPRSIPSTFKSSVGFTTAGGEAIKLSDTVQEKIKADLKAYEENLDENEPILEELTKMKGKITSSRNEKPPASAKRKNPSDDVTPFGRKRARTSADLKARILFSEINEEDEEIIQSSLAFENNQDPVNDRNLPFKNSVTEEIQASTAAFLEDLENYSNRPASSRWSDSSFPASSSSRPTERRPYSFPNDNTDKSKTLDKKLALSNQELIPDDIVFDSQEFLDAYEKISTKIKLNEALEKKRNDAIGKQENIIRLKRINRERRIPGCLLQIKEQNKDEMISLRHLCLPGTSPSPRNPQDLTIQKIDPAVSSINSSTSENYQFNLEEFYQNVNRNCVEGITVGDGALLIPNEHNMAGITEFKRSFLASPGVDPTLIPQNWVDNHYKWIIWKLASMDRLKFTGISSPKCLTPDRVLKQLKYRYDREIDRAERPILRRILEKDDAPARRMILCVSRIKKTIVNKEINFSMELTDGWYSIAAAVDIPMINNIISGKIKEGTKLMIYGAQLMNADEGCHPLDIPDNVRLKIHTNSTRRAKWYTKLGLQKYAGPMELSLRHIHPNGGLIGKVSAVVSRLYPIIYKETTLDGQVIFRNAKSEEKAQMSFSNDHKSRSSSLRTTRDVTPCLKIRITDGSANGIVTIWQNAEECSEMFKEGNSIMIIHGTAAGKRSNELQINATRWTTFDVSRCKKIFTFPVRIFTPLSDTMTQGFTPNYGEFDTVGIVVSIGPAPHGMKNFETVYLAYRNDQEEDSFLSILFWEGVVSYGYSDIATIGSIICCLNCEWRRNTYRSIPTAFCTERTIITRNPRQGSHLRSEFDALGIRIEDVSNYVDYCARKIQCEVIKKSSSTTCSFSGTPGRNSGDYNAHLTPKNQRSAAIKSKLDKLNQIHGIVPKLSPITLAGSSRVSHEFKSPLTKTPRTEFSGWKT